MEMNINEALLFKPENYEIASQRTVPFNQIFNAKIIFHWYDKIETFGADMNQDNDDKGRYNLR